MTTYFINGRPIGDSPHPFGWSATDLLGQSVGFFCPACGELWGRAYVPGRDWMVATIGCEQHPHWPSFHPGGSFILSWNPRSIDLLPHSVLRREFLLHFNHWKNRNAFEQTLFEHAHHVTDTIP